MDDPELLAHREWLGYLQPIGVVVSPPALIAAQAYVNRNIAPVQELLLDMVEETPDGPVLTHISKFLTNVLRWEDGDLEDAPAELEFALPEYGEVLRASYAVREPEPDNVEKPWMMLLKVLPNNDDLDTPSAADDRGWSASPEAKFERLLREAEVPIGLLFNATHIRLVYSPRGETSGYLTFPMDAMTEVAGRPVLAALEMLLSAERLFSLPKAQRLPAILSDSRRYQNEVSTRLADQVLAGLYELLRGLQTADDHAKGNLLRGVLSENPDLVYEGLLTVLLRLVFLLYSEDRDLMPVDEVYTLHYSVGGLFDRLRADAGRHPDTMNLRYGAWAQLLSLFRIVFDGVRFGGMHLPARHGHLFDPDRFPFLEGRPLDAPRSIEDRIEVPLVADGVVWRVLQNLLVLDGERLSYRSLDVEQIGSVYETMMGFQLEIAGGQSLALRPAKPHGAPITINVDELLASPTGNRAQWVRERAEQKLTRNEAAALASASTVADVEAAVERKIDRRATPNVVAAGSMVLQPNEERRRSGSFYTPRSLTEPIVRTTLRPLFDGLGDNPTPDAIFDLKVCDPAMGSGAFLVEACRQLADKLIDAWHAHDRVPAIPPDSDELLHARRLIAHRCLYGVDRNPIAVDLAKLSLWLATLARDHSFTFLDHSLRCGDSLIGLTRDQIVAFHWLPNREGDFITRSLLQTKLDRAEQLRAEIREASDEVDATALTHMLRDADDVIDDLRLAGDLAVIAFFSGSNERERQTQRDWLAQQVWSWQQGGDSKLLKQLVEKARMDWRLEPFHWQVEFPEVFERPLPGFDAVVSNPPWGSRLFPMEKAWLKGAFPLVRDFETAIAFTELALERLIHREATVGLLLPDSFLINNSTIPIRNELSQRARVVAVADLSDWEFFPGATVRACSIIAQRVPPTDDAQFIFAKGPLVDDRNETVSVRLLKPNSPWTGIIGAQSVSPNGVDLSSYPTVGDYFQVKQGYIPYRKTTLVSRFGELEAKRIISGRTWHAKDPIDDDYVRELQGSDVDRCDVTWSGTWVRYGPWVATYLDLSWFSGPRVLVREIVGRPPHLIIAAKCEETFVHNPSIIVVKPNEGMEWMTEFLELYLNSSFASDAILTLSGKAQKGIFPKVLVKDVRGLAFPSPDLLTPARLETLRSIRLSMDSMSPNWWGVVDSFVAEIMEDVYPDSFSEDSGEPSLPVESADPNTATLF